MYDGTTPNTVVARPTYLCLYELWAGEVMRRKVDGWATSKPVDIRLHLDDLIGKSFQPY